MAEDNRDKVTDYKDYFAKWGPKGFLSSTSKVVPFLDLKTGYAMRQNNSIDTSSGEAEIRVARDAQRITFRTRYVRAAGVDPRDQMSQWYNLVGEKWPFYVGGIQFGPPLLQLEDVHWTNIIHAADGTIISADAEISLVEWYEGIEIDMGWVQPETSLGIGGGSFANGDIFSSGLSSEQIIWTFLRQNGFSPAAAAGVMGNWEQESGNEFDVHENDGTNWQGYGVAQWTNTGSGTAARKTNLINWCTNNGYDYRTAEGQLNYFLYEWEQPYYKNNLGDRYKQMTDPVSAAWDFLAYFEGGADNPYANWPNRKHWAQVFYNKYKDYVWQPTSITEGVNVGASGVTTGTWLWPCPDTPYANILLYGNGTNAGHTHNAGDIQVSTGNRIVACDGGTVTQVLNWDGRGYGQYGPNELATYGNSVLIHHSNGYNTRYAHMSKHLVSVGQSVAQGQLIGYSGNTGNSQGPHLHLEIYMDGSGGYQGLCPSYVNWKR